MYNETIWVTNYKALRTKYGVDGAIQVWNTIVDTFGGYGFDLSDDADSWGYDPVTRVSSCRQNKNAIDVIFKACNPYYLIIIGASDVVPFQDLENTCMSLQDQDAHAWGDIPYACDAPYSKNPANFRAPTRVVGRIPDLVGASSPSYVVKLLKASAKAKSRRASDYESYLGVTAAVWKGSTSKSLDNIFGSDSDMQTSPTNGPVWTTAQMKSRAHFINCHGAEADPFYYGEKNGKFPKAHSAAFIAGKIAEGTVATAECCYGAELYDPSVSDGQAGICSTYLDNGAYGFFGSSTIAYGPANGQGAADLITQYFMKHVLAGASLGRAVLQARQEYIAAEVSHSGAMDPVALKTLAQFYLLGDPTIHPVEKPEIPEEIGPVSLMKGLAKSVLESIDSRSQRRQDLIRNGAILLASAAYSRVSEKLKPSSSVKQALNSIASNLNLKDQSIRSFSVSGGVSAKAFGVKQVKRVFHTVQGAVGSKQKTFTPAAIIVAEERDGEIVSIKNYERR